MALIDKLKAAGEQATASARESLEQAELHHCLNQAYSDLGRTTFALLQQGELSNQRLAGPAQRIRELESELAALPARGREPRSQKMSKPIDSEGRP